MGDMRVWGRVGGMGLAGLGSVFVVVGDGYTRSVNRRRVFEAFRLIRRTYARTVLAPTLTATTIRGLIFSNRWLGRRGLRPRN
jgi:hypothetical protein